MVELTFECVDVTPDRYGVSPTLLFRLRIAELAGEGIHAIALRCQIRIEPARQRCPEGGAEAGLAGDRPRRGDAGKPMQFAQAAVMVPSFTGSVEIDVPVPVSHDLEVATGPYRPAVEGDPIALALLFSGTVFGKADNGFRVEQVPWHAEAAYQLPLTVWVDLMDHYFPDGGWLRLRRGTLDSLRRYKAVRALATWDEAVESLVDEALLGLASGASDTAPEAAW